MGVEAVILKGIDFTDTIVSDGNTNTDVNASNSTVPNDVIETLNKYGDNFNTADVDGVTQKWLEGLVYSDGTLVASSTGTGDIDTTVNDAFFMDSIFYKHLSEVLTGPFKIIVRINRDNAVNGFCLLYLSDDANNYCYTGYRTQAGSNYRMVSAIVDGGGVTSQNDLYNDHATWFKIVRDSSNNITTYYDSDQTHSINAMDFVWTQHLTDASSFSGDVAINLYNTYSEDNTFYNFFIEEGTPAVGETSHRTTSSAKSTAQALGTDVGSEGRIRLAYEDAQNTVQIKVYNADTDALLATADAVSSGTQEELDDHTTLRSDADLEAYFKYEDDATDEKGNHNGTPANITYTGGPFNQAAVFNGSNATIDISGGMLRGLQQFSIASMVYVDNTGSGTRYIYLEFKGAGTRGRLQFYVSSTNKIVVDCEPNDANTSGRTNLISNSVLSDNTWYHVVVTMDLSTRIVKIYINGLLDAAEDDGSGSYTITDTASLNADIGSNKGAAAFFKGRLDETYLFKRLLTAAEIYLLYSNKATLVFDDVSAITGNIDVQSNFVSEEIPGPGHGVGLLEFALDTTPGIVAGKRGSIII